jgi:hypothetical protein
MKLNQSLLRLNLIETEEKINELIKNTLESLDSSSLSLEKKQAIYKNSLDQIYALRTEHTSSGQMFTRLKKQGGFDKDAASEFMASYKDIESIAKEFTNSLRKNIENTQKALEQEQIPSQQFHIPQEVKQNEGDHLKKIFDEYSQGLKLAKREFSRDSHGSRVISKATATNRYCRELSYFIKGSEKLLSRMERLPSVLTIDLNSEVKKALAESRKELNTVINEILGDNYGCVEQAKEEFHSASRDQQGFSKETSRQSYCNELSDSIKSLEELLPLAQNTVLYAAVQRDLSQYKKEFNTLEKESLDGIFHQYSSKAEEIKHKFVKASQDPEYDTNEVTKWYHQELSPIIKGLEWLLTRIDSLQPTHDKANLLAQTETALRQWKKESNTHERPSGLLSDHGFFSKSSSSSCSSAPSSSFSPTPGA